MRPHRHGGMSRRGDNIATRRWVRAIIRVVEVITVRADQDAGGGG